MIFTYVILTVVAVVVLRHIRKHLAYRHFFHKLPGYKYKDFSYLTGNMHLFPGNNEEGLAFDFRNIQEYRFFHRVWAGPLLPVLLVYHPEAIRPILKSSAPKPRSQIIGTPYDFGIKWLGEGLLLANGPKWARSRRLLTPAFHFDILKSYTEIYNECTDILISKLQKVSESNNSFDIYPLVNLDALDVILRCAFSYKSNYQITGTGNEYVQAISQLQTMWADRCLKPHLWIEFLYSLTSEGKTFYKMCNIAHKVSEDIIEQRRKELQNSPDHIREKKMKDFLDTLLTARDEDGLGLSPLDVRNEVDTFLFEGHDTTASGLTWTFYALAQHPEHQERVYEEVIQVLGEKTEVEWSDLAEMEFLTMCIKEAMRVYCPVPFIERQLMEETEILGHKIPAGTRTSLHLWMLHHNPYIWDDPHSFIPERFHPEKVKYMDPFQFVPFSAGSRNCIGQNFAMNEMKTTVAKVIRSFKLMVDPSHEVRRTPTVTMKSETGVFLSATRRH